MNLTPDDYFNNGLIEAARFGNQTIMKNNLSDEQCQELRRVLSERYSTVKAQVENQIINLRDKICKADPLSLLSFSSDLALITNLGIESECQQKQENLPTSIITEYIQSVYVSTPISKGSLSDDYEFFQSIKADFENLYNLILSEFYPCWFVQIENKYPQFNDDVRQSIFEAQIMFKVRGKRYQIYENEFYKSLLDTHNDVFKQLFNITSNEITEGIQKLQFALSQGKFDEINRFQKIFDEVDVNSDEIDFQDFLRVSSDKFQEMNEKVCGTTLRDVIKITGWSEHFVSSLSWELNECKDFFNNEEFSGWPILDLPIQKRPFIKIGNSFYCFDYYSFVDNFYRAIQKSISRMLPDYKWSDHQKEASEGKIAEIFSQILPGCKVYADNYYPKNSSIKNHVENDLIVKYNDIIIIVEVKAGSFVYTSPIKDFESHIKSYKTLIEKADHQCRNTFDYLNACKKAKLYNSDHTEKAVIDMSKIKDIFMMSVTIDNINAFAAHAEKLYFLELKSNAISLSIDELMVYRDFFDSPLVFLHFLAQRRAATQCEKLVLNDELDHLGLYINYNIYTQLLSDISDNDKVIFHGFREDLDRYFNQLYHPQLNPVKPQIQMPELFRQFIKYLDCSSVYNKSEVASYLLSFSQDAKEQLCNSIEQAYKREQVLKRMIAFNVLSDNESDLRYTVFVNQPGIVIFSDEYKIDYTLSNLYRNEEPDRILFEFYFDSEYNFRSLKYKKYTLEYIKHKKLPIIKALASHVAQERLASYISKNGLPKDEDICPCMSGKKYIDCCKQRTEP